MHDLVIRGAMVADGVGNPLIEADVAVSGERIAEVGDVTENARETVDADGLVLAPGIVDVHTHYDAQLTWDSQATPSPSLGVTTVVMGNCGFSIAPCPPDRREQMARNLAEVEGMPVAALEAGIDWSFESFPEYLALLRRKGCYPNAGVFVGHSAVRTTVLGAEASERAATEDEIAAMRGIVTESMEAGAIGFATSTSINHYGDGGVPMPSRLAEDDEMSALVGVLGELGRGIFQLTVGPSMTNERLEGLAAQTGRPVFMTAALHNETFPERAIGMLEGAAAAQSRGNAVWAQVSCQPLSMDFSMRTAFPLQSLDAWEPLHTASDEEFLSIIGSEDFRNKFRDELEKPQSGKIFYGDWRRVEVAMATTPAHRLARRRDHRDHRRARGARPGGRDVRHRRGREARHHLQRRPAQRRRGGGGRPAAPRRGPHQPLRCRRPPLLPLRRRLRPAPARPLGARQGACSIWRTASAASPACRRSSTASQIAARSRPASSRTCCSSTRRRSGAARSGVSTTCPAARAAWCAMRAACTASGSTARASTTETATATSRPPATCSTSS